VVAVQDNSTYCQKNPNIYAVRLGPVPDMQRGRDGSKDGRLLLVVGKPLARKVGTSSSALRDLEGDRSLDIPIVNINTQFSLRSMKEDSPGSF
jgi:hypothetical protein